MLSHCKFTLQDSLILIAATAPGLLAFRVFRSNIAFWPTQGMMELALKILFLMLPCVLSWTLVLPVLRLRRPHTLDWRREPGMVACLAVAWVLGLLALVIGAYVLLLWMIEVPIRWSETERDWIINMMGSLFLCSPIFAGTVAFSWKSLTRGGHWRAEHTWIDRAGRVLGAIWIVAGLISGICWLTPGLFSRK